MITADQLLCHAVGDYVVQSDWMALEKTKRSLPAAVHALTYCLAFLFVTRSVAALAVIIGTHFVIDRWRLARFVCWGKNFVSPAGSNPPWSACRATGYPDERPPWMTVWLMIIADNTMHVAINGLAIRYFG